MFSAIVAAAAAGFCQSPIANAEPLKGLGSAHLSDLHGAGVNSWKMSPIVFAGDSVKAEPNHVASATRRLDLSKLTMADFGDVEQSR